MKSDETIESAYQTLVREVYVESLKGMVTLDRFKEIIADVFSRVAKDNSEILHDPAFLAALPVMLEEIVNGRLNAKIKSPSR